MQDKELSTEEFAAFNRVKAQTIRARLSRFGSYYGVTPQHLANSRLVWPKARPLKNVEAVHG